MREMARVLRPGGMLVVTVPTIPGYPPHRVLSRFIALVPKKFLLTGHADKKGRTLQTSSELGEDKVVLARATSAQILEAFGHFRHYTEDSLCALLRYAGFEIVQMQRFQMLFESEMIYFSTAVRGMNRPALYPFMRAIALLDKFLPRDYPGVGLMAVCRKPQQISQPGS
jgi:hypothetical protein